MQAFLDLSEGEHPPAPTKVLAILFLNEKKLYAVTTILDGAPWFGLVHEVAQLQKHPVPLEDAALRAIANNSQALDIYCWLAYRLHALSAPRPYRGRPSKRNSVEA